MSKASNYSDEDEWLVQLLTVAAEEDGMGSSDDLFIECLGLYEKNREGFNKGNTDSFGANWINIDKHVYVKVDWETETTNDNSKISIDFQVYVSTEENKWKCTYSTVAVETLNFDLTRTYDPTTDGGEYNVEVNLNGSWLCSETGWDAQSKIDEEIQTIVDSATYVGYNSGVKDRYAYPTIDLDSLSWNDPDPTSNTNPETASATVKIYEEKTEDYQVYSRPFSAWQPNDITLELTKTITDCSSFLSIPIYDLSGVKFEVYSSETGGTHLGTITISDFTGTSTKGDRELTIPAEYANKTIYIEEVLPNDTIGYEKPSERIEFTLGDAGKTSYVTVENTPVHDPVSIKIMKESDIDESQWIGSPNLEGIEYTLEYYTSESSASYGSSPFRTWTFETDSDGEINCQSDNPTSGTLFKDSNGDTAYPVGWYRFYESTSESELHKRGLEKNENIYYLTVTDDGSGKGITTVYTDSSFSDLAPNTRSNATNNVKIYEKSDNLYGTIEPEHWEPFAFVKRDIYLNGGPAGDAVLTGAEFTVYCEDDDIFGTSVEYDGHTYSIGWDNEVEVDGVPIIITIDDSGRGICPYPLPITGNSDRFYIIETSSPNEGYKTPEEIKYYVDWGARTTVKDNNGDNIRLQIRNSDGTYSYTSNIVTITYSRNRIEVNDAERTYSDGSAYNTPRKGSIIIEKYDNNSDDNKAQGDASLAGIKFAIVNASDNAVKLEPYFLVQFDEETTKIDSSLLNSTSLHFYQSCAKIIKNRKKGWLF